MKTLTLAILGLGVFALSACDDSMGGSDSAMAGTGEAQRACIAAVNERNVIGSTSPPASVTGAEFSEAGSMVQLIDGNGTRWSCLASNSGEVEELNIT
jgi:hypothetical protein